MKPTISYVCHIIKIGFGGLLHLHAEYMSRTGPQWAELCGFCVQQEANYDGFSCPQPTVLCTLIKKASHTSVLFHPLYTGIACHAAGQEPEPDDTLAKSRTAFYGEHLVKNCSRAAHQLIRVHVHWTLTSSWDMSLHAKSLSRNAICFYSNHADCFLFFCTPCNKQDRTHRG